MDWKNDAIFGDQSYKEESIKKTVVKCPVCKKILGYRLPDELFVEYCEECKANFTFYPNDPMPTAELNKVKPKGCECASCRARK